MHRPVNIFHIFHRTLFIAHKNALKIREIEKVDKNAQSRKKKLHFPWRWR